MRTGVQFTGTLGPNAQNRWFTFNWPVSWHVVWYVVPTNVRRGAPQVDWDVSVERADSSHCTYWITVKNLTDQTLTFEGRYAIMNA
jgi:hypothetical protein